MANMKIDISDGATPFLQDMIKNQPVWIRKGMQAAGLFVRKEIKDGIKSGAPGGVRYAKFMPAEMRAKLEKTNKKTFGVLGKMASAVRAKYDPADLSESIGWISNSAIKRGEKIEAGQVRTITQKMRDYFKSRNVPLSAKPAMIIPARETFDPMRKALEGKISPKVEDKIFEYINKSRGV
ncbi:hypothetical protein [Pelosinus sp. UFO1]|uniref:hypothetical protein n=1 Tax=Pelosinus sp. UFO1 TaxID=484770 RepID=UPI0004D10C04|nr:hypothetical protein [Pelosinus sp. UFO1]AIF52005.1 hypothetical protein UFO1_2458 [Pelosinus sp. UFO1]